MGGGVGGGMRELMDKERGRESDNLLPPPPLLLSVTVGTCSNLGRFYFVFGEEAEKSVCASIHEMSPYP